MHVMRNAIHMLVAALVVQAAGASLLPAQKAVPKHLTLAVSPSTASAAPGSKVSVFVDVTPNPGIHVYAPGAKDFLPIELKLDPIVAEAIGKVLYPQSETMEFDDEKVPVFQKPLRLTQELKIARNARPGPMLTVSDTLT